VRGIVLTFTIYIVGAILYGCPSFDKIPFNDPGAKIKINIADFFTTEILEGKLSVGLGTSQ